MYLIGKGLSFEASHCLPQLGSDHQCSRPHGHSYSVEVRAQSSTLDVNGMVLDYGTLSSHVKNKYDHRDLNELVDPDLFPASTRLGMTAEMLAEQLWTELQALVGELRPGSDTVITMVVVHETTSSSATFIPGTM